MRAYHKNNNYDKSSIGKQRSLRLHREEVTLGREYGGGTVTSGNGS